MKNTTLQIDEKSGRGREIRTPDILLPKQARYQTALYPDVFDQPGLLHAYTPATSYHPKPIYQPETNNCPILGVDDGQGGITNWVSFNGEKLSMVSSLIKDKSKTKLLEKMVSGGSNSVCNTSFVYSHI